MTAEKMIPVSDVVDIIEKLQAREKSFCASYCSMNSGDAVQQRRHESILISSALSSVLYELRALNY